MNTHLTEIAFILDRSGSMESCANAAIAGFNKFLHEQKDVPSQARFTLVLFDDQYELPYLSIPISEVVDLNHKTFEPRGGTALLDAIGRTIDELGARLAALPEAERPGQVIVAILTDGLENASQKYTWRDVAQRITHQREVYKWEFLFLGANQDAIATAAQMNIAAANAASISGGVQSMMHASIVISRKMKSMRKLQSKIPLTEQEAKDANASLSDITRDEEATSRDDQDKDQK